MWMPAGTEVTIYAPGMKVWTCTSFDGHWPVGVSAVVIASSAEEAARLLNAELAERGLGGAEAKDMRQVGTDKPHAVVLQDGDY